MKYHIALSPSCDLQGIAHNAQAKICPSHSIWELSQLLGAKVYQAGEEKVLPIDRMYAKIIGRPEHWALARKLSLELQEGDVIYCNGEHIGIPLATVCNHEGRRLKFVVYFHNINRPRGHLALKLFKIADKIDLFVSTAPSQINFLHHYLGLPKHQVYQLCSQPVDLSFFTPGLPSNSKERPIIGSGGLEKRDYRTLANASKDLDVDIKICAFSHNAKTLKRSFPKVIPSNMSFRFYEWNELLQLYRDSDIVVISLLKNTQEAGLTTLFEAMACRRPVVITRAPGLIDNLIDAGIVMGVNPYDATGMKQAIQSLLNDPHKAEIYAQRGYELVQKQYNQEKYVQSLFAQLTSRHDIAI
ncbi:glycosyltransferase family 4 protein [Scytonema sp. NUACC26]|uniref:glycosyltransferase family 4 protein n=1 Tax=Scytonema sp. NUACC26 TaxID=3140176 RepID=UPI0034DC2E6D